MQPVSEPDDSKAAQNNATTKFYGFGCAWVGSFAMEASYSGQRLYHSSAKTSQISPAP